MKKGILFFIVVIVAVFNCAAQSAEKLQNLVFIREITGKVEIRSPGTQWQSAAPGMGIQKDGEISTGFKSMAVVAIGNSVVTVKPLTRLALSELISTGGQEKVNLNMPAGRIQADVKPPVGGNVDFSVKTPQVTASVLGTTLEVSYNTVSTFEGSVAASNNLGQSTVVNKGESQSAAPAAMSRGAASSTLAATNLPTVAGAPLAPAAPVQQTTANIEIKVIWD